MDRRCCPSSCGTPAGRASSTRSAACARMDRRRASRRRLRRRARRRRGTARPSSFADAGRARRARHASCSTATTTSSRPSPSTPGPYPPFGAVRRDGRIYGRGSTDAKANVLALVSGGRRLPRGSRAARRAASDAHPRRRGGGRQQQPAGVHGPDGRPARGRRSAVVRRRDRRRAAGPRSVSARAACCSSSCGSRGAARELHSAGARLYPNPAWRLVWALASIKGPDERVAIDGFGDADPAAERGRPATDGGDGLGRRAPSFGEAGLEGFVLGLEGDGRARAAAVPAGPRAVRASTAATPARA